MTPFSLTKFSPFTLNALQKAAALNYEKANYRAAAEQYRRLSESSSVRSTVEAALSGYIRSVDKLDDPQQTLAAAETVLASASVNDEIRLETQYALGRAYLAKNDRERALEAFRKVSPMRTRNGAEAQYQVIRILYEAGRLDEAEQEIFRFSETNTSYPYWLGRSFLLLGDIYVQRGDGFQAKATYQSIVTGYPDPSDGIIDEAKARINSLK